MKSKKHFKSMEPIKLFLQPRRQPVITTTTKQSTAELSVRTPLVYQNKLTLVLNSSSAAKRKAELIWTLKCVWSDMPALSVAGVSELFEVMFSYSQIVEMSRAKMTYLINFAIARYFPEIFISEFKSCNYYLISLDESVNDITQTCKWMFMFAIGVAPKTKYVSVI